MKKRKKEQNGKILRILIPIFAILILLAAAVLCFLFMFQIESITVEGNIHYTDDEIMEMVMDGFLPDNSLVLSITKREVKFTDKAFLDSVNVQMTARDSVRIRVNEKGVIGYVECADQYWYFDREGIVVEQCAEPVETVEERKIREELEKQQAEVAAAGIVSVIAKLPAKNHIPEVRGFNFKEVVLNEPLPMEDDSIFNTLYSINQMMNKNDIRADFVMFDEEYNLYVYVDDIEVRLGQDSNLEDKMTTFASIMSEMEGMSGILHLENYTSIDSGVIFEKTEQG